MTTYASEHGDVTIAVTGDAIITRRLSSFHEDRFLALVDLLRGTDATIANAEMLFHDFETAPTYAPGGSYMRAAPALIDELRWLGVDMLGCANNHSYDFGENGVLQHLKNLCRSEMPFAGIGRTMSEALAPAYLDTPGGRIALISATSSGPQAMYAGHSSRDGHGRPGANLLRYATEYTVDADLFDGLRRLKKELGLVGGVRDGGAASGYRDHSLGLSHEPDSEVSFFLGDLHDYWQYPVPNGHRIVLGDGIARRHVPDMNDIEANLTRIRNAKGMADWVVVSLHNHESGLTDEDPSEVATTFARMAIDAGADIVMGHGPHRDRGIEIYHGRPIFYSIGHFILQNDTVDLIPYDNVVRMGLDPATYTPHEFFNRRSGREQANQWIGRSASADAWRDFVGLVEFRHGKLHAVNLVPLSLGYQLPRSQRGRPVLASEEDANALVSLMDRLSRPFGTRIALDSDGRGRVELGDGDVIRN